MRTILSLCLLLVFAVGAPLSAQEKAKGKKANPEMQIINNMMKQLEKAELTDEQSTKIKEMMKKIAGEIATKRTEAGITADKLKSRLDAMKSAKEAGKKGKDLQAAAEEAMGLTEEQKKVYADTEAMLAKARIEIGKMLTPEQMAKLPEQAQASMKEKAGGKKGKKQK